MEKTRQPLLSVITATYNAEKTISRLVDSLRAQSNQNFEWIVVDGGSTDATLELVRQATDLSVQVSSQSDFGIYDALNRGIKLTRTPFYLVIGADDFFNPDAFAVIERAITPDTQLLSGNVIVNGEVRRAKGKHNWLKGMTNFISAHSVGTVVRASLHQKYGLYSRLYPLAADQAFIGKLAMENVPLTKVDAVLGSFSSEGISSVDYLGSSTEFCRVQIDLGYSRVVQSLLCVVRILMFCVRSVSSASAGDK